MGAKQSALNYLENFLKNDYLKFYNFNDDS